MAKLTLLDVANLLGNPTSAANTLNVNNTRLETALENTLSRDGTSPNQMEADLDLNNNDILNVKTLQVSDLTVGGENVQGILERAEEAVEIATEAAALAGSLGIYENVSNASVSLISPVLVKVIVLGYYTAGDAPLMTYKNVPATGSVEIDQFQSLDGRRWQLVAGAVDIRQVGIIPFSEASATSNTTRFNSLVTRQRTIIVPGADFYLNSTIRLRDGTFIRGTTTSGVTWTDDDDGVISSYGGESRLIFVGSYFAAFDSTPAQPLLHGAFTDLSIMIGVDENIERIFNVHGMLGWTFQGIRMENNSGTNPGGFYADQVGSNPTWLNRLFDTEIRIKDASGNRTFSAPWTDSCIIGCAFTGGSGAYYYGDGNFAVIGGIYDRAAAGAAAWIVDKLTPSSTSIKFIGCDIDINDGYGIIVSAQNSPSGDFFGILINACHFRAQPTSTGDILFVDNATTKMTGMVVSNNTFSVSGVPHIILNYGRWDAQLVNNQFPDGAPWETFTPVVSSGTGTLTSASASMRYLREGRKFHFTCVVTVTTNGTGASYVNFTLPFAAQAAGGMCVGRENASTGVAVVGLISSTNVQLYRYDNTYPGGDGRSIRVSGTIELAA